MKFRIEKDSLGSIQVPADKLYGPQTARAVINFPISDERFSTDFIKALAIVKHACTRANQDLGFLSKSKAHAIICASDEIMRGQHADQFPISIWQSGSGTQTNMNINEVIAKRSAQLLKTRTTAKQLVHPNDDVNHGQSSNDVIPTAMHVAAVLAVKNDLIPSLKQLHLSLREKSKAFKKIIKIGRTHLMDATPLSLGAEFSAYATQIENNLARLNAGLPHLYQLALGATAVGTGVNAHPRFSKKAIGCISQMTKQPFKPASNKYEAIAAHDALVQLSATFKTLAVSLMKIANDIRLLGSGPRCGIGELILPANEPGSSIMPGKVNPTQCESLAMVCAQVIGYDAAITIAGAGGHFQLNTYKPLIIHNVLSAVRLLSDASLSFSQRCVQGIRPNHTRIKEYVDRSLMLVTALAPRIGYDHAAQIAQDAHRKGITLRQAALESGLVDKKTYDTLINPNKMIRS